MTPVEHAKVSAKLAKAIGWPKELIWRWVNSKIEVIGVSIRVGRKSRDFDYRDPAICVALIKRYRIDVRGTVGPWAAWGVADFEYGETLELAVARAVIVIGGSAEAPP